MAARALRCLGAALVLLLGRVDHSAAELSVVIGHEAGTGFDLNLPSFEREILEKVRIVGLPFARGVNELDKAGLTALASARVKLPRIQECLRHFECEVVWTKEWLTRMMVVGNVVAASTYSDCVDEKGYIVWDRVKPVAFCGAPYVDMFAASQETMRVGMPYEGPEVAAADRSVRSYFEDM
jgi:hypothetical protein